jgi:hypothetical protein
MFRAFTDHPETVGETYLQHMGSASWFAMAIFPFAFQKTGSARIKILYERMVTNRHRAPTTQGFVGYAEGI